MTQHNTNQRHEASRRNSCRFCGSPLTHSVVDLGVQPPCNSIVSEERFNEAEQFYPLHAMVCDKCFLVQLETDVSPDSIYTEYSYFSSFSDSWLEHARNYVEMISARLSLNAQSRVIELASNDGYLLQYFIKKGIPAYGIDPAENVAKVAIEKGVPTIVAFFGVETARKLASEGKQADLILGNNVFGHIPDINDFVGGMKVLLKPGGTITIEIPHFMRLMEFNQFDTIYHEHYCYHTLHSDTRIFAKHGLRLFDVEELTTHGGSTRMYACHDDDPRPTSERVQSLMALEVERRLDKMETYAAFGENVRETKRKLLAFLIQAKRAGKSVVGYGAPGKGNTLLNYCGIRSDFIDYVVDRNPYKQGKFLPGSRIPIFAPEKFNETKPDYVLILPWNIKEEVMKQMAHVRDWGAKFVVPIPEVKVLD
jgi:2-polyprenyl-3-methyl-5-hydroxy-6-metoxy-1,4-benzoquinol methylase